MADQFVCLFLKYLEFYPVNLKLQFKNILVNKFHEDKFEKLEKNEIQKIKAFNKLN